jgi:tRNA 2-thiocytidine biosynthesis protein TtcA
MLEQWEKDSPGRLETISRALADVRPSQLSDRALFDFMALGRRGDMPLPDGRAWMAEATVAATDDDEAMPAAPKPDALAALRAKTFDPIWNP